MPQTHAIHRSKLLKKKRLDAGILLVVIALVIGVLGVFYYVATHASTTLQPVARLAMNNKHLYTIFTSERDNASANGWTREQDNYFYASPSSYGSWTVPIYRLHHSNGDFLYSKSSSEGTNAGYTLNGVAFYVGADGNWGSIPVYRMFHSSFGHFLTTSTDERQAAVNNGWTYEGILFYAYASANPAPPPPTSLRVASLTHNHVTIAWNAPTQGTVTSYVLRITGGGSDYWIGPYGCCSGGIPNLKPSKSYTVSAQAENAGNKSSPSSSISFTTPAAPVSPPPSPSSPPPSPSSSPAAAPSAPTNLKVDSPTSNTLHLSWGASVAAAGSSISGYQVINSAGTVIAQTNATNYTVSSLTSCSTYSFTVKAINNQGRTSSASNSASGSTVGCATNQQPPTTPRPAPSQPRPVAKPSTPATNTSTPDKTPPSTPNDFTATLSEDGAVVLLTWRAASDDRQVAGYKIERSTDQSNWSTLADTVDATEYTDASVAFETNYFYRIHAKDEAGNHSPEALAQVKTGKFTSNVSGDAGAGLSSDDGVMSVVLPPGSVPSDQVCVIVDSKDNSSSIAKKLHLLAGPYMIACKNEKGEVLSKFDQPVAITFKVTEEQEKKYDLALYEYTDQWKKIVKPTYDNKARQFTFNQTDARDVALLGTAKTNPWPLILSFVVPLILFFVGFVYIRLRQQKQAEYQAYLKRKYYDF